MLEFQKYYNEGNVKGQPLSNQPIYKPYPKIKTLQTINEDRQPNIHIKCNNAGNEKQYDCN